MSGNTIGKLFTVTTFGESHGAALGCVIDGCPPGLALTQVDIQQELDRRRPGSSPYVTQRQETDTVEILSGVFEGYTTGTAIGLLIRNEDAKPKDYAEIKEVFRPGHADYTYLQKYGRRDYRGGGRASARETVMRVAAGAVAKKYLLSHGIQIRGYLAQVGDISFENFSWADVATNPFFFPDSNKLAILKALLSELRKAGDSIGAKVCVAASGMLPGLGEPVFDKLDAEIAYAMMSIPAVKGVEIGAGFNSIKQKGSAHRDEITPEGFITNHAGGILGGISSGQDILVSLAVKPASSIRIPGKTIDIHGQAAEVVTTGRHDPCVGIRAVPVAEAMLALVLADHWLRHRAQNYAVEPPLNFV